MCCLQTFFFTSDRKQVFFWRSTSDNFFFMFCRRVFLSYASPIMCVTIWCFSWSTYFSSISTTNFFFLPTFSTNFFFLTFVTTNNFFQFFSRPPPPRYQMVRPLVPLDCGICCMNCANCSASALFQICLLKEGVVCVISFQVKYGFLALYV